MRWGVLLACALALPASANEIAVEARLAGHADGETIVLDQRGQDLYVHPGDLAILGLTTTGNDWVLLSSLGIQGKYDATAGTIELTVPASLMKTVTIDAGLDTRLPPAPVAGGLLVNYDIAASRAGISLGHDARLVTRQGTLQTTGQLNTTGGYVRGNTTFRRDNYTTGRSIEVGDTPATGSSGVTLGGASIGYSRQALDPLYKPFTLPTIGGIAPDAGTLMILDRGGALLTQPIERGPFTISNAPLVNGNNALQLVLKDKYGREQVFDQRSIYFDASLLAPGETEWRIAGGAVRVGQSYGDTALSAMMRNGFRFATVTVDAQSERDGRNTRLSVVKQLGRAGVVSATVGTSTSATGTGREAILGWRYASQHFNASVDARQDHNWFRLGLPNSDERQVTARVGVQGRNLNVGLGYFDFSMPGSRSRQAFLDASIQHRDSTLSLRASQDFVHRKPEIALTWSHPLNKNTYMSARVSRAPDAPGPGYGLRLSNVYQTPQGPLLSALTVDTDQRDSELHVAWDTPKGKPRLDIVRTGDRTAPSVGVSGALYIGPGGAALTRTTTNSFGVVRVGTLPGIPVLVENQNVGATNKNGLLVVPNLTPGVPVKIDLTPEALPANAEVEKTTTLVNARRLSSASIDFPVKSLNIRVFKLTRTPTIEAGASVTTDKETTQTGYDGILQLSESRPGQRILVSDKSGTCTAIVPEQTQDDAAVVALTCQKQ